MPFVKLDCGILDSSVWAEASSTRIVWITLLAMADATGLVRATAPGISSRANVGLDETRKALELFESPDVESRSLNDEGRKIKRVDGGYLVVNYEKFRARDQTAAERMRRFRSRNVTGVTRNHRNESLPLRKQKQKQSTEEEKEKKPASAGYSIPDVLLCVTGFPNEWVAFVEMRRRIRKPMTDRAAELILKRLSERPIQAVAALQKCIEKSWQSFEWDWLDRNGQNGSTQKMSAFEITKRIDAIEERLGKTVYDKEKHKEEREQLFQRRKELKAQLCT